MRTECTFLLPIDSTLSRTNRLYVISLAIYKPSFLIEKCSQLRDVPECAVKKTELDESSGRVAYKWQILLAAHTRSIVSVLKKAVDTMESYSRLKPQLLLYWQTHTSFTTQTITIAMINLMIMNFTISRLFLGRYTAQPFIFLNNGTVKLKNKSTTSIVRIQERQFLPRKPNMYMLRKRQQQKKTKRKQHSTDILLRTDDKTNRYLYLLPRFLGLIDQIQNVPMDCFTSIFYSSFFTSVLLYLSKFYYLNVSSCAQLASQLFFLIQHTMPLQPKNVAAKTDSTLTAATKTFHYTMSAKVSLQLQFMWMKLILGGSDMIPQIFVFVLLRVI